VQHYIPIYLVIGGALTLAEDVTALWQSLCLCRQNDDDDDNNTIQYNEKFALKN